jgi:hypothetical protein
MKPIHPIAQTEMLAELAAARVASEMFSIEQLLKLAGDAARWAGRFGVRDRRPVEEWPEIAELLANRASRLVPGAKCMHRALAGRVWLARRGIAAQIVVGFRKRGTIEGHAWLELQTPEGTQTLFNADEDGYRESFREVAA